MSVKILQGNAKLLGLGTMGVARYDLCAASNYVIPSWGKRTMDTRLVVSFHPGTYTRIAPHSGLSIRKFINVGAGVVDSNYWGEIKVVLFSHFAKDLQSEQVINSTLNP